MNGKLMALLLLCMSVYVYMANGNKIVENYFYDDNNEGSPNRSPAPANNRLGTGGNLGTQYNAPGERPGFHTNNFVATPPTNAYSAGNNEGDVNIPGYQFVSHARLGLNAGRGGDTVLQCNQNKSSATCDSNPTCVWTGPQGQNGQGGCRNNFETRNQSYNTHAFLEQQFEKGTMGADWVKESKKQEKVRADRQAAATSSPKKARSRVFEDDDEIGTYVKPFGSNSMNETRSRGRDMESSQTIGRNVSTCLGRAEVPITISNKPGEYNPAQQVSRSRLRNVGHGFNPAHEDLPQ